MTSLVIEDLHSGYDGLDVLRGVTIEVEAGQVAALLGPNGAGKSTTLLSVCGVVRPRAGEITLGGERITGASPDRIARAGVGHVPEDRALFRDLTVGENLNVATRDRRAVDEVLSLFPALGTIRDRKAGVLSGGEQQMLGIARALVRRPAVVMIDEMSLGLAPVIVQAIVPAVRAVADEYGTAVLLVEQHIRLALQISDRAYVMNRGAIQMSGTGAEMREKLAAVERSYFGESNGE